MSNAAQIQIKRKQSSQHQEKEASNQIKIREFQWYQVETRVRQLMGQILQPFNKKQTEETVKINEIKRNITTIFKRQEEYDFLLEQGTPDKPKYLQLQDQKIEQMQMQINKKQLEVQSRINKMENTLKIYEEKIKQLNNMQIKLDHQVKERIKAFDGYKDIMDGKFGNMMNKLQAQNDEINTIRGHTRNSVNKIEIKLVATENRIRQVEDEHKRKSGQIHKLTDNVLANNEKVIRISTSLNQVDQRLKIRQEDAKMAEKFFRVVDDVKNDLGFIKGYLERYQPLYTQMQISDTLHSFLTGKAKRMLCLYEQQMFARYHFDILQGSSKNSEFNQQGVNGTQNGLQYKMGQYSDKIKAIINRNKKHIIKYKVNKSIKLGQNVYQVRMTDQNTNQDEDQQSKKPVNIVVPEQEIRKIIDQKWIEIQPKLENKVIEELKPTKLWIQQLQQQSFLREAKTDERFEIVNKNLEFAVADFQLFKSHSQTATKQNTKKIDHLSRTHLLIMEQIKDVINFGSVINHIVIQDQIDRQGLALYALKSGSKNQSQNQLSEIEKINPTIHLDQKCVACKSNSSSALVNQSFKMACLAYNPSQIRIDDQTFSRQEILEVSTNILQKLKNKVDNAVKGPTENSPLYPQKRIRNVGSRRSQSQFSKETKTNSNTINASRTSGARSKELQTMLPVLSTSKKSQKIGNLTQRSLFY